MSSATVLLVRFDVFLRPCELYFMASQGTFNLDAGTRAVDLEWATGARGHGAPEAAIVDRLAGSTLSAICLVQKPLGMNLRPGAYPISESVSTSF